MAARPLYAAMAQHASFEHERLKLSDKSVRLFQVHPIQRGAAKDDPISLRMTQFSEHRRPPYKAISYTWGSPHNPRQILVNGRAFVLHVNLWNLLYHLRLRGETSFLWADALCINQQNMRERNFHVQLMGKIYEKAESVVVWLGLPSPDRTEVNAINFIKEMADFRKTNSDFVFTKEYFVPAMKCRWETLLRMTQHIYFTRTWIIQEFLFAPAVEMVSGASSLMWKDYEDLIDLLRGDSALLTRPCVPEILASRITRLTLRRRAGSQSSLHELLQEYSDSTCTERLDKIYGILGLASDCLEDPETGQTNGLTADYEKLVVEVFMDALSCVSASLPTNAVLPAVVTLLLNALHINQDDITEYLQKYSKASDDLVSVPNERFSVTPEYVSPVLKVWSWTSIRDLQLQLESYDWGQHIGYEIQRLPSNQLLPTNRQPARLRRSSSRTVHSALPTDFIPNVIEAANLCTELTHLHNYPCQDDLILPLNHIALHDGDKRTFDNGNLLKPCLILEQDAETEVLRLGFASTNVQRGDLIIQFKGLDMAATARQTGHSLRLIGKSMMVKHSDLVYSGELDPICDPNIWCSHCWSAHNPEGLQFATDALSLAELLMKPKG